VKGFQVPQSKHVPRPEDLRGICRRALPSRRGVARAFVALTAVAAAVGCSKPQQAEKPVDVRPKVQLVHPEKRTISRGVGQPSFIYAYEQTSIYPKVSGYIEKWNVDIGDRIKKGELLTDIYVPELVAQLHQKQAQVVQSDALAKVAEEMIDVAEHVYAAAVARTQEAVANVAKYQASVERWESEVKRLTTASSDRVINPQILAESQKQLKSDVATRDAAKATVVATQADELARKADVQKAKVDAEAARAKIEVDRAEEQRLAALVAYTHVEAPYDGIVVLRNANTGDYVEPAVGDLSAMRGSQDESVGRGSPIYVVARTDKVRVYVDVPEMEAAYVEPGTKARISIPSRADDEIDATVTRTSWALQIRTRTLRAEVDLPNPGARLLPGMYAYGTIMIDRRDVWAVPMSCVIEVGSQNVCYMYDDGKAVRTPVQAGISDGPWIELLRKQEKGHWVAFTGSEQIIRGNPGELVSGQKVDVSEGKSDQGDQKKE
jgi:HlyD family secretion protein